MCWCACWEVFVETYMTYFEVCNTWLRHAVHRRRRSGSCLREQKDFISTLLLLRPKCWILTKTTTFFCQSDPSTIFFCCVYALAFRPFASSCIYTCCYPSTTGRFSRALQALDQKNDCLFLFREAVSSSCTLFLEYVLARPGKAYQCTVARSVKGYDHKPDTGVCNRHVDVVLNANTTVVHRYGGIRPTCVMPDHNASIFAVRHSLYFGRRFGLFLALTR